MSSVFQEPHQPSQLLRREQQALRAAPELVHLHHAAERHEVVFSHHVRQPRECGNAEERDDEDAEGVEMQALKAMIAPKEMKNSER